MDEQLLRVILADNPWLEGEPVQSWMTRHLPETYVPRRAVLDPSDRVCLVVGPRQSGKSTLIWKKLSSGDSGALHLNCEEPSIRSWLRSPAAFATDLGELAQEIPALFLEEVQHLEEAGLFLKGLVDRRTRKHIYATGSSSFDLQAHTRESLAGRARRHLVLPLSLAEVAAVLTGSRLARQKGLAEEVERLTVYGGYPPVYTSPDPRQELASLVEAFVVRDASDRFRIRHVAAFRKILELAASQIGNLCNLSEWAAISGVSNDTVREYCRLLEETHIIRLLGPYVGGKRAEITRARKAFFLDNGIRNQVYGGFHPSSSRPDRGALLENLVFTELSKLVNPLLDRITYWRSKSGAEVDFVVEHQGRLLACEVKAGDPRSNVTRSARSFIAAYSPETFVVVCRKPQQELELDSTRVRFVSVDQLAKTVEEFLSS